MFRNTYTNILIIISILPNFTYKKYREIVATERKGLFLFDIKINSAKGVARTKKMVLNFDQ